MIEAMHENIIEVDDVMYKNDDPQNNVCYSMPYAVQGDLK